MDLENIKSTIPEDFTKHTHNKYEKNSLNIPVTLQDLEAECEGDKKCEKLLEEMVKYAIAYANDVWDMKMLVANKKNYADDDWADKLAKADTERTRLHNIYIESIAALSRALIAADKDYEWVKILAPAGKLERALCGNFAIMLTYSIAVNIQE